MFKEYLESKGHIMSESGRLERCPVCEGEHTAQVYEDSDTLVCFRGSCRLNTEFPKGIALKEYKVVFEGCSEKPQTKATAKLIHDVLTEAANYFHYQLLDNIGGSLDYLKGRGRTIESITAFNVGLIVSGDKLYNRLKERYTDDELESTGLYRFNNFGPYLSLTAGAYSYPIFNNGQMVNIKAKKGKDGCYISKVYVGEFEKFLNSSALESDEVIMVEGENDCMRLWEMGKRNVVATLGQVSTGQIQYIKSSKKIKKVYLCFDNDIAGQKYTTKVIKGLSKTKKEVMVISYIGEDPDVGSDFYWEGEPAADIYETLKDITSKPIFEELEAKYAKVLVSSKVRFILKSSPFSVWLDKWNFIQYESKINEEIIEDWMKKTHCYNGVTVDFRNPSQNINDQYNLFYGFSIVAEKSDINIDIVYDHIRNILCSGDVKIYEYLMDWIAHMFQRPWEVVGTAPVFISKQGAGKGIIIEHLLGKIVGKNYFVSSGNGENFTNSFNSIVEGKLLINVDEASFSGNHHEAGIFKKIIGNETIYIVRKGYEGYSSENRARMIIGSQHDTAVKIEKSNRRYFVPVVDNRYVYKEKKVSEREIQAYFTKLYAIIDNGGREKFYWDMMHRDISHFNRFIPPTSEKEKEMAATDIDDVESWFYGSLMDEVTDSCNWTKESYFQSYQILRSSVVYDLYKKCFPNDKYLKPQSLSTRISKLLGVEGTAKHKINGEQIRGWKIDITAIRDKLEQDIGMDYNKELVTGDRKIESEIEKPIRNRALEYLRKLGYDLD